VDRVVLGARRKGEVVEALAAEFALALAELAFIGDDLLDIPALRRVGLAVAVADASPEVKASAHLVTRARGGAGAAREAVELILRAQGRYRETLDGFLGDHGASGPGAAASRRRRS
jgi:3-deoxy-D-manno-octulosonate 8-phosphate phosphatase (KDO 8-P phosphatase)